MASILEEVVFEVARWAPLVVICSVSVEPAVADSLTLTAGYIE